MAQRYLLDTNVISELMSPQPAHQVLAWFTQQQNAACFTSTITQAEIFTGIALLPLGKRRAALEQAAQALFAHDFAAQCLPFDSAAARHCAHIVATRIRAGAPISTEDAQIAAIAMTHDLPLLTRNVKDFAHLAGLIVVNPWEDGAH
jgi:predicted nucleic acid-binding protein